MYKEQTYFLGGITEKDGAIKKPREPEPLALCE